MNLIHHKNALQGALKERKKTTDIVGFVPTMGALHDGHLSLINTANEACDLVVVSIFVNPTQFDRDSDLKKYPRTLEEDLNILRKNFDNLIVFAPETEEIYGMHTESVSFEFGELANKMEGAARIGHYDGVGTVLQKLFTIVQPDKAFFGEKDYQQLLIVKKLVSLLELPIEIIGCPISRQEDGLARSSRNVRLTKEQQENATFIFQTLLKAKEKFNAHNAKSLVEEIETDFKNNPNFELDYFQIVNEENLEPVTTYENGAKYRAFVAAKIGSVRLIDNMVLN